jgi:hypothetical protein
VFPYSFSWKTDAPVKNSMKAAILNEHSREYDALTNGQVDNLIRRWLETDIEQQNCVCGSRRSFGKSYLERKARPSCNWNGASA